MSKDTIELSKAFYDIGASGYINVRWKNAWELGNEAVDRPITRDGRAIGVITAITDEYVFGVVLFNAMPELNMDRTTTVSFEVINPLNKEVDR